MGCYWVEQYVDTALFGLPCHSYKYIINNKGNPNIQSVWNIQPRLFMLSMINLVDADHR